MCLRSRMVTNKCQKRWNKNRSQVKKENPQSWVKKSSGGSVNYSNCLLMTLTSMNARTNLLCWLPAAAPQFHWKRILSEALKTFLRASVAQGQPSTFSKEAIPWFSCTEEHQSSHLGSSSRISKSGLPTLVSLVKICSSKNKSDYGKSLTTSLHPTVSFCWWWTSLLFRTTSETSKWSAQHSTNFKQNQLLTWLLR